MIGKKEQIIQENLIQSSALHIHNTQISHHVQYFFLMTFQNVLLFYFWYLVSQFRRLLLQFWFAVWLFYMFLQFFFLSFIWVSFKSLASQHWNIIFFVLFTLFIFVLVCVCVFLSVLFLYRKYTLNTALHQHAWV